jgi:hypothetical protein
MSAARTLTLLLCLGAAGAAFAAAPSPAEDSKAVARCVEAAQKVDGFAGNCIGVVADPCIKAARERDSAAEDAKACARRELGVWAVRMHNAIRVIGLNGGEDVLLSVTATQKAWTASQDKLCPLFDNLDPGAALGGADYCRLQETARRALMLERLAAAVSEH